MGLKSEFKPACKKIWKAFNSWRKRGMWFRVTVLLIIGFAMNIERLYTTNHVPLINELVLMACKALRYDSEPRVTSAHLCYLHVQKSRQLQNQLKIEFKAGSLRLNADELKLLNKNTLNANYNKLFALAKRAKLIPANITLSQTKRAMLNKSLKLTSKRFDSEWANVRKMVLKAPPLSLKELQLNFWWLVGFLLMVLPLPIIPALSWFVLCFTLGFLGAKSKYKAKWILATVGAIAMTLAWIYVAQDGKDEWSLWHSYWNTVGVNIFFSIWAIIGSIMGKRLYNWALLCHKEINALISLLFLSGIILLMPIILFVNNYQWFSIWPYLPANFLLFANSDFAPYFTTIGIGILLYALFLIFKTYAQELKKFKWAELVKYLVIVLLLAKLVYSWYPLLMKHF